MTKRIIAVFDFDMTLIDCDSDEWVVENLGFNDFFIPLLPSMPLNSLMDLMMMEVHSKGKTIQDIEECLKRIRLLPDLISALKSARALGWDLRIISDANTFFIETVLKHNGLTDCFVEINTNPCYLDEEGRLRILQYYDCSRLPSHSCKICPPNLCKGLVMEKMKLSVLGEGETRFVYVGDGTPDFCAATKLGGADILLPRKNFPIWELISRNEMHVKAHILEWTHCQELGTILQNLVENTIVREETNDSLVSAIYCKSGKSLIPS